MRSNRTRNRYNIKIVNGSDENDDDDDDDRLAFMINNNIKK